MGLNILLIYCCLFHVRCSKWLYFDHWVQTSHVKFFMCVSPAAGSEHAHRVANPATLSPDLAAFPTGDKTRDSVCFLGECWRWHQYILSKSSQFMSLTSTLDSPQPQSTLGVSLIVQRHSYGITFMSNVKRAIKRTQANYFISQVQTLTATRNLSSLQASKGVGGGGVEERQREHWAYTQQPLAHMLMTFIFSPYREFSACTSLSYWICGPGLLLFTSVCVRFKTICLIFDTNLISWAPRATVYTGGHSFRDWAVFTAARWRVHRCFWLSN